MNLKVRLSIMNFLEFAVWGAYLTSMGQYLGHAGMGQEISWFYAIQGIVSIFMPTLMGIVADKYIQPQRLLGICHLLAGLAMVGLFAMGQASEKPDATIFITVYTISVAFYMPTLALSNTVAFKILQDHGRDTVTDFPPIRVLGTVGFIATMWFVNCATVENGSFSLTLAESTHKFQYTNWQFLVSGLLGFALFLYCLALPECKIAKKGADNQKRSLAQMLGLDAFRLFRTKKMAMFFIFSGLLGMSLQVTNGFATPYITHFKADPLLADTFAANNATLLVSISQIAEAFCILLIPFFLKRYGIKNVMLIAMFAWVLRFGFFGLGGPAFPKVILLILSCLVYGVAFDFFNVSGGLFVDSECSEDIKASAQGLFMLMTNGLGATIGTLLAGEIVNHYCHWTDNGFLVGDWQTCWFIFAGFALVVGLSFAIMFNNKKQKAE